MNGANIQIMGEHYRVGGEADASYIAEVGRIVDERLRELQQSSPHFPFSRLLVLLAINLTDELLQTQIEKEENNMDKELARRTSQLISLLDEGLIADTAV